MPERTQNGRIIDGPRADVATLGLPAVIGDLRTLAELVRSNGLSRLTLDLGDLHLMIEAAAPAAVTAPATVAAPTVAVTTEVTEVVTVTGSSAPQPPSTTVPVKAPLLGVFYRAPAPGEPPFVQVGDRVEAGQQVAIIEAMKLMNPILADRSGVVAEIAVEDGMVVEFGEALLTVQPD